MLMRLWPPGKKCEYVIIRETVKIALFLYGLPYIKHKGLNNWSWING